MPTIAEFVHTRAADRDAPAIRFEDDAWTWGEYVDAVAARAAYLADHLPEGEPPHVGLLFDNTPEHVMWLAAAAVTGSVAVGINPTRRGAELARDITHTDCQLLVTEGRHIHLLDGLDLGAANGKVLDADTPEFEKVLAPFVGSSLPDESLPETTLFMLLFTSGTSGAPKACLLSQGRLARMSGGMTLNMGFTSDDVLYCVMPLFHSNCIITCFAPWLICGGTLALRRRFSASGFLPDVRKFGATYFNYVGRPLSYILATPEQPDDADTTLRQVFGNEGADRDIEAFAERFGCTVGDGYGSTEGGAFISRNAEMPKGSIGLGPEGTVILDPETMEECPPARFDGRGRLLNPDGCIGEIVNKHGVAGFEGYYKNDEANAARVRGGYYWTGDLGYRDADGWFFFAGRDFEWLRVDGENFSAAPVERILTRHPDVLVAAVYAVPDEEVGDQVMAALQLRPGTSFDAEDFDHFLAEQPDLGTKWSPRYVRVMAAVPVTETQKPMKRLLRRERWEVDDDVHWRPAKGEPLRPMRADDRGELQRRFEEHDRVGVLDAG
ncbi:MAG TPA: AMP-binding protein [Acidimicrobiia bacterium]|jgi:fatty-acyl-CoA synthase